MTLNDEIAHYKSVKNIYYSKFSNELQEFLKSQYPYDIPLRSQWYMYVNNINTIPTCLYPDCNKPVLWNKRTHKFNLGCSKNHNQKITALNHYGVEHHLQSQSQKDKLKLSVQEKYGVDSIAQLESTKQKIKQTTKEKYGVDSIAQLESTKQKIKQTTKEKYGVDYAQQSKDIRAKTHQTNLSKFGVEEPLTNSHFRERGHQTNINKYGSIFPMKNKELIAKRLETVIEKYDSYSPLGNPNVNKKFKKTIFEKFYNQKLTKNIYFKPLFSLDEYIGTIDSNQISINYEWLCLVCNCQFQSHISAGHIPTCTKCYPRVYNVSKLETELFNHLHFVNKIQSVRGLLGRKEIDSYLKSLNLGIEFNSMYWYSEQKNKTKNYHLDKTLLAENMGIDLMHIFEYEWVYKKDIIISIIDRKIHNITKININDLSVKPVDKAEKKIFLDNNTLFGDNIFISLAHGLYFDNTLVALMTVSNDTIKHFIIKNHTDISSNPFKLLFDSFDFNTMITYYVDRRFNDISEKNIIAAGFSFEGSNEPTMYYSKKDIFLQQSKVDIHNILSYIPVYNEILTIKENMIVNGYLTIWDCGKKVYNFY